MCVTYSSPCLSARISFYIRAFELNQTQAQFFTRSLITEVYSIVFHLVILRYIFQHTTGEEF